MNSREFVEALEEYIQRNDFIRGTAFEESIRQSYLDYERFFGWLAFVEPYIDLNGKRVLDSGCGVGGLLVAAAMKGATPFGIEVDEHIFRLAETRLRKFEGSRVVLLKSDGLPFEDNYFDAVFSIHVIEHVSDADKYISEMLRVMKRGGVALVEFPNRLYPVEPHTGLWFFPWLPMKLASGICRVFSEVKFFDKDLRLKFRNLGDESLGLHFITRPEIKKRLGARAEILEESYTRSRLLAEAGSGPLSLVLKTVPWQVLKRFSWVFQKNIMLIFRKQ